jgi:hypothetical protein
MYQPKYPLSALSKSDVTEHKISPAEENLIDEVLDLKKQT